MVRCSLVKAESPGRILLIPILFVMNVLNSAKIIKENPMEPYWVITCRVYNTLSPLLRGYVTA